MRRDRFIVGVICCGIGALILLSGSTKWTTAGAVAFGVLGIAVIAVPRGKKGLATQRHPGRYGDRSTTDAQAIRFPDAAMVSLPDKNRRRQPVHRDYD